MDSLEKRTECLRQEIARLKALDPEKYCVPKTIEMYEKRLANYTGTPIDFRDAG